MTRAVALIALTASAGCSTVRYPEVPFSCAGDPQCPSGHTCRSGLCIRNGAEPPPDLLARSNALITPQLHPDADRGGVLACWTQREDQDNEFGAVHGAFLNADGTTQPIGQLAVFDTRGAIFRGTCSPVPHSGGKILVAGWLQREGTAQMQLAVWTPREENGREGAARPFYQEFSPFASQLLPGPVEGALVGDEAWVPFAFSLPVRPDSPLLPSQRLVRLRVNAADLEAGRPRREVAASQMFPSDTQDIRVTPAEGGAWISHGRLFRILRYIPRDLPDPGIRDLFFIQPPAFESFGLPLVSNGVPGSMDNPPSLATLWSDPHDFRPVVGTSYRIGWLEDNTILVKFGPRLPFSRVDTQFPASMRIGQTLYVIGAREGEPLDHRPLDGGMSDAGTPGTDAGNDATVTVSQDVTIGSLNAQLVVYSLPWGADDSVPFQEVRRIPRRYGELAVPAAAAMPSDDGEHFWLAFTEFHPPDDVERGVSYTLSARRYALHEE